MLRVIILARTPKNAHILADLLRQDRRLDIVEARALSPHGHPPRLPSADVLLAADLPPEDLPLDAPPIVLLSSEAGGEMPLLHGVHACLSPDPTLAELSATIIAAAHELTVLTPAQTSRWLRRSPHPSAAAGNPGIPNESLTPRELEVLLLLADGLGNKEIAARLDISGHTAKFHVAQVLAKLRAGSRAEAVAIGMRRGLVPV